MKHPLEIRKETLATRDELSPIQLQEKSSLIKSSLLTCKEITDAEQIFLYVNFRSEVQTKSLIKTLLASGKQVSVPITRTAEKRLDIIVINDPETELIPGYCGIPEPREELVQKRLLAPELLDTIILPGSVFDERCGRFGYGGGYYDRLLSHIPGARRLALAFDFQVVPKLPLQKHDEILDCVITEKRIIRNPNRTP